jgi:GAF domain-containing protein
VEGSSPRRWVRSCPVAREDLLVRTFVELADTLVDDFDLIEVTQTLVECCVELFDGAAGLLLADPDGTLRVFASSTEQLRVVELFEIQAQEGPCLECYRTGEPVVNEDLVGLDGRWPLFAPVALDAGYRSVHALPVRLRDQVLGALNLFRPGPGSLDELDVLAAQAMADATAISILQHRALKDARLLAEQLRAALDSRILIEQAKGMFAERASLSVGDAFIRIRLYAREHNDTITSVSRAIIDGALGVRELL